MTAHALLLSGVPGVGKTTIVSKVAAGLSGRRSRGFVTDEIREGERRVGFGIRTFGGKTRTLAHVDLRSRHRVGRYGVDVEALDEVAESALVLDDETEVYLVDEIGKMECFSERFCTAMTTLLDAGRPVIATIARHGDGFISEVKRRRDIELWLRRESVPVGRIVTVSAHRVEHLTPGRLSVAVAAGDSNGFSKKLDNLQAMTCSSCGTSSVGFTRRFG